MSDLLFIVLLTLALGAVMFALGSFSLLAFTRGSSWIFYKKPSEQVRTAFKSNAKSAWPGHEVVGRALSARKLAINPSGNRAPMGGLMRVLLGGDRCPRARFQFRSRSRREDSAISRLRFLKP